VRGTDHPTSKCQPPRAKAPRARDFARACHDGPIAIVRHAAVFFAFAAALPLTNCKEFVREMWERAMRAGIVAGCVALALLVGGCDTNDSRFFRYGIGTNLYSEDIVQTTQYQDIYLTELCRQALPMLVTTESACVNAGLTQNDWNLIVQAGMNDIDRRCDSYLAWLDDRRRTNNAVLKELGDVTVASQAIMRVAGVGANPITLAGLAFGLAANTFTNVNSRLLLEVDKTTVQTLVLRRRADYRIQLRDVRVVNKPAVVHALRQYLTICTPFTIETDINSTITVFQQVGADGLDRRGPLVNPDTVGTPLRATTDTGTAPKRPPPDKSVPEFAAIIVNYDPKVHTPTFVKGIVRKLCLNESDANTVAKTTAAIQVFQMTLRDVRQEAGAKVTGKLTDQELLVLNDEGKCDNTKFRNFYEASSSVPDGIKNPDVIPLLNRALATGRLPLNAPESDVRAKIPDVQRVLSAKLTLLSAELKNQLTPELIAQLQKLPQVPTP
jgi:hypothetical protein